MATPQGHDSPPLTSIEEESLTEASTDDNQTDVEMESLSPTPELLPIFSNSPDSEGLISFFVGEPDIGMEDPQVFKVHHTLAEKYDLCNHRLLLRNSTPGAFLLLLEWVSTGKIRKHISNFEYEAIMDPVAGCDGSGENTIDVNARAHQKTEDRLWFLLHLYVLAERLDIPVLQNLAVDHLIYVNVHLDGADPGYWTFVNANTKFNSPIRELVIVQLAENPITLLFDLEKSFYGWKRQDLLKFIEHAIPRMMPKTHKDRFWFDPRNRAKYHVPVPK
ncbi:hypothetical protein B7494_g2905 [Chlorociboria aeruginascens]|nr:hypothetical protein B7494_g2905 [Chlorociboria aeruginascens]